MSTLEIVIYITLSLATIWITIHTIRKYRKLKKIKQNKEDAPLTIKEDEEEE